MSIAAAVHRASAGIGLLVLAAALVAPAAALPPPPPRTDLALDLSADGPEQVVEDTVRAYQAVPIRFAAQAGDRLLLQLAESGQTLVLQVETPSGLPWLSGARPGPDGLVLSLAETGAYRLLVLMSADAARAGRAASFRLRLRLRR